MPYTMADFRRDYVKEHLKDLTPEEVREGLPPEEYLKVLSPEDREALFQLLASQQQQGPSDDSKRE